MKRKLANSTPSASRPPPKKRERGELPLLPLTEGEIPLDAEQKPASESDIQLLRYQNRQLANALQERKEEIVLLSSKLRSLTSKQSLYDNSLGFVARNWDSLNDNLHALLARLDPNPVALEDLLKEDTTHPAQETRSFLQLLLQERNKEKENEEEEETEELNEQELATKQLVLKQKIDTTLDQRAQAMSDLFLNVVALMQREKDRSDGVSSMLKEKADALNVHDALANENKGLRQKIASVEQTLEWLQFSNTKLKNQNAQCKGGWIQAEKRMRDMIVELEDAKMDMSSLRNRCRRLHDQIQDMRQNQVKLAAAAPVPGGQPIKQENISQSAGPSNPQREEDLAEFQMRDEERLKEIKELRAERTELVKEISTLRLQLSNPSDTNVFKSPQYQLLYQQSRLALMDLESLRTQHVQLQHSCDLLEEHMKQEKESLLKSEAARRKSLEEEVREKMGLITRLRGEREDLQYRIDQKKTGPPASKVAQDFKIILSSTQAQNKKLEKEVKRLKGELAQAQESSSRRKESREELGSPISGVNGSNPATPVVTKQVNEDQTELQEKVRSLQKQIEDFQRREKKMEETQRETKVMLEVYQSESKEKRDVTEIRRAERRVIEENKRLQVKLQRYERDPRQGQPSGPPRPEGEKHRHEKPPQPGEKREQHQQPSERAIQDLKKALENEKREGEMLLQEMAAISKSFEELQEQNSRLLQQLSEKDDSSTKLLSERIKSEQVQNLLREETKTLQQQLKLASEKSEQQTELLQKEGEKLKAMEQHLEKSNEQFKQMSNLIDLHKRTAREAAEQAADLRNRLEHASNVIAELKKSSDEMVSSLHREEDKVARLAEERNSLKRRVDKFSSQGSADSMLEEELAATKKLLICPVCNDRKKDTVITRCFHVFCAPCIKKNLAIRHRKCPGCSKPFGDKDVQSIYLDIELGEEAEGKE